MNKILAKIMGRRPKTDHRESLGMQSVKDQSSELVSMIKNDQIAPLSTLTQDGITRTAYDDGTIVNAVHANNFIVPTVIHDPWSQPVTPDLMDVTETFEAAALENAGSARPMIRTHKYQIATHLETAARMVSGLENRRNTLQTEGIADSEDFEKFKAEKEEEISIRFEELTAANTRRAEETDECERLLRFYRSAPDLTAAPGNVGPFDPYSPGKLFEPNATCPPFEECSASGSSHSFSSFGPDGVTVQCDYCGKEAPEQFQRPKAAVPQVKRPARKPKQLAKGFAVTGTPNAEPKA